VRLLHAHAGPRSLAVARWLVFGLWLVKLAADPLHRLAALPVAFVTPVGVLRLFGAPALHALLAAPSLWLLRGLGVLACALALGGRFQAAAAGVASVLLLVHQSLVRSFGYVNHAEIPLLYAAFILALVPVAERLARGDARAAGRAPSAALVGIVAVLCGSYALTGLHRVVCDGPAIFDPQVISRWVLGNAYGSFAGEWTLGRAVADSAAAQGALMAGLVLVTAFEILAPLCLVSRRFRLLFVVVMVPFHVLCWLTMNILFWENMALFLLLLDLEPRLYRDRQER